MEFKTPRCPEQKFFAPLFYKKAAAFFAFSFLLLATPAFAADPLGCGSIVLPTGIGTYPAADLTSFNPLFVTTADNQEAGWSLYPNLVWINRFSQIDWSRSLARSVTTADNTKFIITMRPWRWSDGTPVTAEDSAYFFRLAQQMGAAWPGYGLGGLPYIVKSLQVLSATQLQITTIHPVNPDWFIYNAIGQIQPLPEQVWGRISVDQMFALQTTPRFFSVVDGPLKLQSLDIGQDAVFIPDPAWPGGDMHFSRLVFKFLEGDGRNVQGTQAGDTDAAMVPADLLGFAKTIPQAYIQRLPQTIFVNVIELNFRNPAVSFFRDVRVRQAIEDAVDQNTMNALVFHGAGVPAYGAVPQNMTRFLSPAMRQGIYPVGYNPEKSRALLAAAGYTPGPDGILEKNGQRLSFTQLLTSGSDEYVEISEFTAADLRKIGIDMKIKIMDFNEMLAVMDSQPLGWEASLVGEPAQNYPSGETDYETGAFQNSGGYSDPKMDALINASINNPGLQGLYDYETYLSAQLPVIFLPGSLPVILANRRLHGLQEFVDPAGQFAPEQLYCTRP